MDRKNGHLQNFVLQHQARTLCAKFSSKSHIMVSGDNKNIITLWRLDKEFPITTLTASQGQNNQFGNEITSVCFAPSQYEIFSGSDQGYMCMWDIRRRALNFSSKEHTSFISCIKTSNSDDFQNFVLTGSNDSTIKGWDIREKKSIASYNEHKMKINCIEFSPDGQIFVTGSDDSLLKIWDIRTQKCLRTFSMHKQPITCAIFNPFEICLASTSADGTLNYWDLENFDLMYSATVEENSIQKATFDSNGEFLFTGAKDTLRLWHVNSENLQLIDKISIGWDGIQDLEIQANSKTGKEILVGVNVTPTSFGLWGTPVDELNKNIEHILAEYNNLHPHNIEEENPIPNEMMHPQVLKGKSPSSPFRDMNTNNRITEEFPASTQITNNDRMEIEEENGIKKGKSDENPASMNEIGPQSHIDIEHRTPQNEAQNPGSKMELEENLPFNELLESTMSLRHVGRASMMNFSYFNIGAKEGDKKELETISEIAKEHSIFQAKMIERAKKIRNISSKWKSSFAFETVPAIESLDKNEAPMIMSLINTSVVAYRIEKVPIEVVCALLKKALLLLETKFSDFSLYVKIGLGFIDAVFQAFSKDILPKVPQTPNKNIKGEVPKKFTKLVEAFEIIFHHEILKEIALTDKSQMGKTAKKIISDIESLLGKIKAPDFNKPKKKI